MTPRARRATPAAGGAPAAGRRFRLATIALAALLALLGAPAAHAAERVPAPELRSEAALVIDASNGETLYARRAEERRAIASTTKLMTALLTLERAELDDVLPASSYRPAPIESQIGLRPGERMRVRDLLVGLLLESANDAAVTLAEGVSGSRPAFVAAMNRRARQLGLRRTTYANPIGLDDPGNRSTARDLARLARRLMRDSRFRSIVRRPSEALDSGARPRVVENRNDLVGQYGWVDGIKTGRTSRAGFVLVGAAHGRGAEVISVVLGAPSEAARDADSLALLRFGLDAFRRRRVLKQGEVLARPAIRHDDERRATLVAAEPVTLTVRRGRRVERRVRAPEELEGPIPAGWRVGEVQLRYRGRVVETVPLRTAGAIPEAGLLQRMSVSWPAALTLGLLLAIVSAAALVAARTRRRARRRPRRRTYPAR